jgi:hypothetical protein
MKISVNGTPRLALALAMLTTMAFAMVQSTDATQGTVVNVQKSTVATPEITGAGDGTDNPCKSSTTATIFQ